MSKANTSSSTSKGSSVKPASAPSANPNYPSTTGNKSGGNRGNTPKR